MSKSTAEKLIITALKNPNLPAEEQVRLLQMMTKIELSRLAGARKRKKEQLSDVVESVTNTSKPKESASSMGDEAQRAIEDLERSKEAGA